MSRAERALDHLQERLRALSDVAELGRGRLPVERSQQLDELLQRAGQRLGHGSAYTVVALAGATGSGKSSTFNVLAGRNIAQVGVRRPTTSVTEAVVFVDHADQTPAAALLDWLAVPTRTVVVDPDLAGLVLLDLPDHDSVQSAHRAEVDRLAKVIDVFCWVVDPQKYADAALHQGYLRALVNHAEVTVVVLNQIDTLAPEQREQALGDLRRLLAEDGMDEGRGGVRVLAASARTGEGLDRLRRELAARVQEHRAAVARIDADVDWVAQQLQPGLPQVGPAGVDRGARQQLVDALGAAAGVDAVADAVAASHRRASAQVAGWPPTRWVARLKPDPLKRLGLSRRDRGPADRVTSERVVPRTGLGAPSAMADAALDAAIRQVATDAGHGLPPAWQQRLNDTARSRRDDLADALDRAVGTTELPERRPTWWRLAGVIQMIATAAMVIGLLWLVVIGVVAWFALPDLPSPKVGAVPLPTLLAIGGAVLGLLTAAAARWVSGVAARRRAAQARRRLRSSIEAVAEQLILDPLRTELEAMSALATKVRAL